MDYVEYEAGIRPADFLWHRAKSNLVDVFMNKISKRNAKLKILNVGAGTDIEGLRILNKYGDVYVLDINKEALSLIDANLCAKKILADARSLPFKHDFFDVVLSLDVFEHIKEDAKVAMEVHRVLKKGGFLIWTVPAFQMLFTNWDVALHHKRRYSKKMVRKLLSQFNIVKISYWNSILFLPIAATKLIKKRSQSKTYSIPHLPSLVNTLFYNILNLENLLIKWGVYLPPGFSIVGYCQK